MAEHCYPWLQWQPIKPDRWEREIDEAELFYTVMAKTYEGTGRMFFAITGFMSITVEAPDIPMGEAGEKVEVALRDAWLRLRYDQPTIATRVDFDPFQEKWRKSYTPLNPEHAEKQHKEWLHQTFVSITPNITGLEWCNADPPAPKLPTLFVISPRSTGKDNERTVRRDLVIRSPHDIMDGIGTLILLNNLLTHTVSAYTQQPSWNLPEPGTETNILSPPFRVAAAIPPILTLHQQEQLQHLKADNEALRRNVRILTLPFKQGAVSPGKHQRVALELSTAETAQLLTESKRLGATVTHLYHAAIAIALRDIQAPEAEQRVGRYISYSLMNERKRCKGEYATSRHAAAVYHSVAGNNLALNLIIPSIDDVQSRDSVNKDDKYTEFCSLVNRVKIYYHTIRDSLDFLALAPCFWSMITPNIPNPASADSSQIQVPAPNTSPSVSLSSMGVIDKIISPRHGPFRISNPWVTGEELGTGLGISWGHGREGFV